MLLVETMKLPPSLQDVAHAPQHGPRTLAIAHPHQPAPH
jgi:hypothetical protein